jgi:hypothetical protein
LKTEERQARLEAVTGPGAEFRYGTSTIDRLAILTKQLPSQEEILLVHRLYNDTFVILTDPGPTSETEGQGFHAQVNIWSADIEQTTLTLIQNHRLEMTAYLGEVRIAIQRGGEGNIIDVEMHGIGDGPFGWEEINHEYLRSGGGHIANTVWSSNFGSKLHIEIGGERKAFTLETRNGCNGSSYQDELLGIRMNDEKILFKKPLPFECLMFGEGDPMPALPGFSAPRLEYGSIVFSPPVGADISIPLEGGFKEIRSDDFAKE